MAENTNNGETASWEVVSVTDSIHALGPHGPSPQEKTIPPSEAMFMSGHFSLSKNTKLETLLMSSDSKTLTETLTETDSKTLTDSKILTETDSKNLTDSKILTEPDSKNLLMASESKTLTETLTDRENLLMASESGTLNPKEDSDNLSWMEPKLYSPSVFNNDDERETREMREDEREMIEDEREMREEEEKREIAREEREEWWEKMGRYYWRVKREKMFVVFVTASALVGVAILSKRFHRERIQLERLKLRFNFTNERMNSMVVGHLSKIKGVFPTDNINHPMNQASYADFTS